MEGRRSSQLWKDEGSVLEAIDELMTPSSDFNLSDIQDKQEAKSTKEHQYDEEDYKSESCLVLFRWGAISVG